MERLLQPSYSSTIAPSKSQLRTSPFLYRAYLIDSPSLRFSSPICPMSSRVSLIRDLWFHIHKLRNLTERLTLADFLLGARRIQRLTPCTYDDAGYSDGGGGGDEEKEANDVEKEMKRRAQELQEIKELERKAEELKYKTGK